LPFSFFAVAFLVFDSNNDGMVDKSELMTILQLTNKRGMTPAQLSQIVDSIMARWDPSGHGRLEYDAFKQMMGSTISNLSL
jgi:Ca2+-binding EF-hand superfamily protein